MCADPRRSARRLYFYSLGEIKFTDTVYLIYLSDLVLILFLKVLRRNKIIQLLTYMVSIEV